MVGVLGDEVLKGIIPRSFEHIMKVVNNANAKKFLLRCSYIEVYNENVCDLLGADTKKALDLKEDPKKGVYIKGLNT